MRGIQTDILFLACTRPALMAGVPLEGFAANACLTLLLGMWLGSPLYWLLGVAVHFPMRAVTSWDHNFFRIGRLWLETKGAGAGSEMWGGSALSPVLAAPPRKPLELASSV